MLEPRKEEIEAAKKDLASITKQGFKFMASMDVTRNQLKHVSAATIHLKNTKSKIGAKVRNLSYKLLREKSKSEAMSVAEEKAKSIVSNLTQTLDKLKSKTEAAKKEKDLIINGEVAETKEEIKKALLEIKVSEERFQGAMECAVRNLEWERGRLYLWASTLVNLINYFYNIILKLSFSYFYRMRNKKKPGYIFKFNSLTVLEFKNL